MKGYLLLIQKDSDTHMNGLTVYVKVGLSFVQDLSLENSANSYFSFRLASLHSDSYFLFLYYSPFSTLWTVFGAISSSIDEVLSIKPSANVFGFGDWTTILWLTYSSWTDRLVYSVIIFQPQIFLPQFSMNDARSLGTVFKKELSSCTWRERKE